MSTFIRIPDYVDDDFIQYRDTVGLLGTDLVGTALTGDQFGRVRVRWENGVTDAGVFETVDTSILGVVESAARRNFIAAQRKLHAEVAEEVASKPIVYCPLCSHTWAHGWDLLPHYRKDSPAELCSYVAEGSFIPAAEAPVRPLTADEVAELRKEPTFR